MFEKCTDLLSRTQLRKTKMNSKYLDDVIAKTGMDYDEAVERIEREQRAKFVALSCFSCSSTTGSLTVR